MATADQAICLRVSDYSETSQVLTLLTRTGGIVRLLAKGSRRPKSKSGGAIDLLAEGRCVYTGAGRESLATLVEFGETVSHTALRKSLARLNAALYLLELCGAMLAEGDPHPQVYDLLQSALARLERPQASPPVVLAYFQWRLVEHVGLLGRMEGCAGCGQAVGQVGVCFSSAAGGLLCHDCQGRARDRRPVPPQALAGLKALAAAAGRRTRLPEAQAAAVNALLAYHIQYQLGRRLKTAPLVLKDHWGGG